MNRRIDGDKAVTSPAVTVTIALPGEYRIALPTDDEARQLELHLPDGKLLRIGDRWVWIEPERLFGEG
jgi:hypothetical protein